jgi:4-amino-4-deoxy-L-arabinose transferase-like glycosyltransferase
MHHQKAARLQCLGIKNMTKKAWSDVLWGNQSRTLYLMLAAALLLLTMLGSREIWTQEHRWADIVSGMFYRHDFLHPYLNNANYYDKPLLSYWLIAGLSALTGKLSTWTLRLPSALAGLLAVWSIYRIGFVLINKRVGLLSGWLLLTTYYFIFWGKTSSADMLNLGGTLFAVAWYVEKRNEAKFFNYAIFFLILAVTSLLKGLVGAIVPLIVIFPDMIMNQNWKKHLNFKIFLAMIPALIVYALPFLASSHYSNGSYTENGLYLVYRENVLRYFQPFDHKGSVWTYFLWLPIYLLPWAVFFLPAVFTVKSRWKNLSPNAKWLCWSVLLLFIFFTVSGSRRNYYILPLVPFAILMTSDWILSNNAFSLKCNEWVGKIAVIFFVVMFLAFDVIPPLFSSEGGINAFAEVLKSSAEDTKPWSEWNVVMLDPESKVRFYLQLPPTVQDYPILGADRKEQTHQSLLEAWPMLKDKHSSMIYLTRKSYEPLLRNILPGYKVVEAPLTLGERVFQIENPNAPVAFISRS